ncbi:MAG TPA: TonB family protein [Candidatus Polarisedimenticolia bacterium]|jgi:protein TonB|nr:TonB family protein [Candidatus Polarisedimenticolia bacterium]
MSDFSARLDEVGRSTDEPTLRLGRLASPVHESHLKSLLSNLKDFLTERPVKVRGGAPTAFGMPRFGSGLTDNLKEFFRAEPRGPVNSALLVNWSQQAGLWQNLRDLISPPKLPPLKTTSQPVPVPEIWSKNAQFSRVQALSLLFHVVAIALVILIPLLIPELISPPPTKASAVDLGQVEDISPYLPKLAPAKQRAGGGGGQHDKLPANKGRLPKFSWTQVARPMVKPPEHPEIAMTPTVLGNPDIKLPNQKLPTWGDPFGKASNESLGQGRGTGVGSGNGAGVGPGQGWNTGGGAPNAGSGGYGYPKCLYCPRPDYTDEAMKVKIQGAVLLIATITADGRVTDIHVVKGLGFGLDEKAIETVRTWRLQPAAGPDGRPAAVRTPIEAVFHLY